MWLKDWRVAVVVVVALAAGGGAAVAQTTPSGLVVLRNESGARITIGNIRYTDEFGAEQTLNGTLELAADADVFLLAGKEKVRARKLVYDVTTADGTTRNWFDTAGKQTTDTFPCTFTADNMASHRKQLAAKGKADEVKAKGPTPKDIERGAAKVVGALVSHLVAQQEPETLLDVLVVQAAVQTRDELIGSAIGDLFPQLSGKEARLLKVLTVAALDGNLTEGGLKAAEAKEQVREYLRENAPDLATAAEVAEFLVGVEQKVKAKGR